MKNKNNILIILLVIAIVLLAYITFKPKKVTAPIEQNPTGQPEVNQPIVKDTNSMADNLIEYKNSEIGFYFKYPKSFGEINYKENMITFTKESFELGSQGFFPILYVKSKDQVKRNYISSKSEESTGDYNPRINENGWESEKKLIENNKNDGIVDCLTDKDGVFGAKLCQIKTIGQNKFLVKYELDSYKGDFVSKIYITYGNNLRFELSDVEIFCNGLYCYDKRIENVDINNLSERELKFENILSTLNFSK